MPSTSASKIQFHFLVKASLKERGRLKLFLQNILKREGVRLSSLNYIFCSDEYLLSINKTYLSHNYYTDIITFDLSEGKSLTGEIYISVDRVRDNALRFDTSLRAELHRVIFHGLLHLCGYGDKSEKEKIEMRQKEDQLLKEYL